MEQRKITEFKNNKELVDCAIEAISQGNTIKERKIVDIISHQFRDDYNSCHIPNRIKRGKKISDLIFSLPSPNKRLDTPQFRLVSNLLYDIGFDDEYANTHLQAEYRQVYNCIKLNKEEDEKCNIS